jgi:hypothetical protein
VVEQIDADEDALQSVLIEVNANYARGRAQAKERSNSWCSRHRLEWVSGSSAHFGPPLWVAHARISRPSNIASTLMRS